MKRQFDHKFGAFQVQSCSLAKAPFQPLTGTRLFKLPARKIAYLSSVILQMAALGTSIFLLLHRCNLRSGPIATIVRWHLQKGTNARNSRVMRENFPHNQKCAGKFCVILGIFAKKAIGTASAKEFVNNVLTVLVI